MYGMVREARSVHGFVLRLDFKDANSLPKTFVPHAFIVKAETRSPTLIQTLI